MGDNVNEFLKESEWTIQSDTNTQQLFSDKRSSYAENVKMSKKSM